MGGALLGHVPVPAGLGLLHHRLLPRLGRGVAILTVAILTVAILAVAIVCDTFVGILRTYLRTHARTHSA